MRGAAPVVFLEPLITPTQANFTLSFREAFKPVRVGIEVRQEHGEKDPTGA